MPLQSEAILKKIWSCNSYGVYGFEVSIVCGGKMATTGPVKQVNEMEQFFW